jgi:hypothetical protein
MDGQAFEFTPGGIFELKPEGQPQGQAIAPGIMAGGAALEAARAQQPDAAQQPMRAALADPIGAPKTLIVEPQKLNRREWRKELQARLKVVQREIKRLRSLEDEEAELQRLIAAAKQPPAKVTRIDSARRSG